MTKLTGVGHSLKEAQVLQQKVADAIKILQVTSTHTHLLLVVWECDLLHVQHCHTQFSSRASTCNSTVTMR